MHCIDRESFIKHVRFTTNCFLINYYYLITLLGDILKIHRHIRPLVHTICLSKRKKNRKKKYFLLATYIKQGWEIPKNLIFARAKILFILFIYYLLFFIYLYFKKCFYKGHPSWILCVGVDDSHNKFSKVSLAFSRKHQAIII